MKIEVVSSGCLKNEVDPEVIRHLEATNSFMLYQLCYSSKVDHRFSHGSSDLNVGGMEKKHKS